MKRWLALALCSLALCSMTSIAHAQPEADAARALDAHRPAEAERIAREAIESGTHTGTELAPLYRVLGLALAYQNDSDAALQAFTRWLALEPEGRLDRSLPDEVRSPFMEARGFWASATGRLSATVELADDLSGVEVHVVDPSSMAARVRTRVRVGSGAWADTVRPPAEIVAVAVPGLAASRAIDYSITFLDEHGNRIWQDGTDAAPRHLEVATAVSAASTSPDPITPPSSQADATPFHIAAVSLAVVAVGAVIGAAVVHADRERLAGIYNGDGSACTGTGSTRGDRCAPERSAISTDESVAIALYAVAGAAGVTAAVLAAIAPSGSSESQVACGAGPGDVGISCGGTF